MAGHPHIFLSYSHQDTDSARRLAQDLARAGVSAWIDHEWLPPGASDWQRAVRRGIEEASLIIFLASEDSARSAWVMQEINLALSEGKPVIPFWVSGERWQESAPFGLRMSQFVDGRGDTYPAGVARLLAVLPGAAPAASALQRDAAEGVDRGSRSTARLASLGFEEIGADPVRALLPPLVTVPAGAFIMGSGPDDPDAQDDEQPQHVVEVAEFQIGKYPVTVAEYALAVRACALSAPPAVGMLAWRDQLQRLDHPVVGVSRANAMAYVAWLREVTGGSGWRLPNEAQWEKAARWNLRREESSIYPWGAVFDPRRCNTFESGIRATTAVGSYPAGDPVRDGASPYGAEDMVGNVWEWTTSRRMPYPFSESDGRESEEATSLVCLRGGAWSSQAVRARTAYRGGVHHINSAPFSVGFRIARVLGLR